MMVRPFTGQEFLESLRDAREVWIYGAQGSGRTADFTDFAERCMAEYDLDGWKAPDLINADDVSLFLKKNRGR